MNDKKVGGRHLSGFFKRNGVFLALAISVLLVGAVVISGVTQRLTKTEEEDLSEQQQVEQTVTGQKDTRTTSSTSTESLTTTTIAERDEPQLYRLPLTNTVQKSFSAEGPLYCETMKDWRLHLGTDFAGESDQDVYAVTDGTVVAVKDDPLWGGVVEVDHGVGVITRYCGVKSLVKKGDEVEMGEVIGELSLIPCECAQPAHLHFEMLVDGTPIDPVTAIALEVRYADTTK